MKLRNWAALGGVTLGALGLGVAIKSFLHSPLITSGHIATEHGYEPEEGVSVLQGEEALLATRRALPAISTLPEIDITFLRCGSVTIPECIAVRGASPFAS